MAYIVFDSDTGVASQMAKTQACTLSREDRSTATFSPADGGSALHVSPADHFTGSLLNSNSLVGQLDSSSQSAFTGVVYGNGNFVEQQIYGEATSASFADPQIIGEWQSRQSPWAQQFSTDPSLNSAYLTQGEQGGERTDMGWMTNPSESVPSIIHPPSAGPPEAASLGQASPTVYAQMSTLVPLPSYHADVGQVISHQQYWNHFTSVFASTQSTRPNSLEPYPSQAPGGAIFETQLDMLGGFDVMPDATPDVHVSPVGGDYHAFQTMLPGPDMLLGSETPFTYGHPTPCPDPILQDRLLANDSELDGRMPLAQGPTLAPDHVMGDQINLFRQGNGLPAGNDPSVFSVSGPGSELGTGRAARATSSRADVSKPREARRHDWEGGGRHAWYSDHSIESTCPFCHMRIPKDLREAHAMLDQPCRTSNKPRYFCGKGCSRDFAQRYVAVNHSEKCHHDPLKGRWGWPCKQVERSRRSYSVEDTALGTGTGRGTACVDTSARSSGDDGGPLSASEAHLSSRDGSEYLQTQPSTNGGMAEGNDPAGMIVELTTGNHAAPFKNQWQDGACIFCRLPTPSGRRARELHEGIKCYEKIWLCQDPGEVGCTSKFSRQSHLNRHLVEGLCKRKRSGRVLKVARTGV